ncbi:hypothetical protein MMC29_004885 [Sticta canariensis]|nr:hypothetical protein [Sticta canariensis]
MAPQVAPENMFVLSEAEAYAGISKSDWDQIILHLKTFKPRELDDLKPKQQKCKICRQSFLLADDGTSRENPVSLPCGHVFGQKCLSRWIAAGAASQYNCREYDDHYGNLNKAPQELFREDSSIGREQTEELLTQPVVWYGARSLTCPTCRKAFTFPKLSGEEAAGIEARLRFWDGAYEKLGIVRSEKEEVCRQHLLQMLEVTKAERSAVPRHRILVYEFHAQVSAMRFAIRRGRSDLTPVQCHLRDGLFNLGCYGVNDSPEKYCAEAYDNRGNLPLWCLQFERLEHGMKEKYDEIAGRAVYWNSWCLGPWRRKMFADTDFDRLSAKKARGYRYRSIGTSMKLVTR